MRQRLSINFLMISGLMILLVILFFLDIALGSVIIPFSEIINVLLKTSMHDTWNHIILELRLPRASMAVVAGAGLSLSGLLMQTLFRNPLAGPFVLGISSGASLGVALLIMTSGFLGYTWISLFSSTQILAAIIGSLFVFLIIFWLSLRIKRSVSLLIVGILLGSMTGALVSILQFFSSPDKIEYFLLWTFGNLGAVSWEQFSLLFPVIMVGFFIAFFLHKSLDAFLLGENYAFGLGVSLKKVRVWTIISTTIITGTLTAFVGPLVFIGVAVPHLARGIVKTSRHIVLLPATIILGSCLLLLCDIISQLPGSYKVLPINSITALVGAPVIIWIILKRGRRFRF